MERRHSLHIIYYVHLGSPVRLHDAPYVRLTTADCFFSSPFFLLSMSFNTIVVLFRFWVLSPFCVPADRKKKKKKTKALYRVASLSNLRVGGRDSYTREYVCFFFRWCLLLRSTVQRLTDSMRVNNCIPPMRVGSGRY